MSFDDRTEPLAPPGAAPRPWPTYDARNAAGLGLPPAQPPQTPPVAPQASRSPRKPARQPRRAALWGVLGFVVGVIITALVAAALLAPAAAPSASGPASGAPLSVTLTDALISDALDAAPASNGVILTQNHAHIQADGRIVISGVVQGPAFLAGSPYTIVAQPYVSQQTLAIKTLRFSVAGFALPTEALIPIQTQINEQLAQSSRISPGVGHALVVSGVRFSPGVMTITYTAGDASAG